MTDGNDRLISNISIPAELRQEPPRSIRFTLTGRAIYYLIGSAIVSAAIAAGIMIAGLTPREIVEKAELRRDGTVVYADSVHVGGMRSATVFYSFRYNGVSYTGDSFLPQEYLDKVRTYSRVGGFPIVISPSNPRVSHPLDLVRPRLLFISLL